MTLVCVIILAPRILKRFWSDLDWTGLDLILEHTSTHTISMNIFLGPNGPNDPNGI